MHVEAQNIKPLDSMSHLPEADSTFPPNEIPSEASTSNPSKMPRPDYARMQRRFSTSSLPVSAPTGNPTSTMSALISACPLGPNLPPTSQHMHATGSTPLGPVVNMSGSASVCPSELDPANMAPLSRTTSWWSNPGSWRPSSWPSRSIRRARKKKTQKLIYASITFAVTLFTASSAAYFTWRSYQLQLWSNEHEYHDYCLQLESMGRFNHHCTALLESDLPPPPYLYSHIPVHASLNSTLGRRSSENMLRKTPSSFWNTQNIIAVALVAIPMLGAHIMLMSLIRLMFPPSRREHALSHELMSTYVRMEPQVQTKFPPTLTGGDTKNHFQPESTVIRRNHLSSDRNQQKTQKGPKIASIDSSEAPEGYIDSISECAVTDSDEELDESSTSMQSPSAKYVVAGNSLRMPASTISASHTELSSTRKSRLLSRLRRLDSSQVELDATALPANTVLPAKGVSSDMISGNIAFGLARAGATLASTAGGTVTRQLLVQQLVENESERLHNMLHSGKSAMRTRRETDYDEQRESFVSGVQPSQHLKQRPKFKSATFS